MILWEEPGVNPANIEDVKLILGGETCRVDGKWATGGLDIQSVPVFMSSNHELCRDMPMQKAPIDNRCIRLFFGKSNPDIEFPISFRDWHIYFKKFINFDLNLNHVWKLVKTPKVTINKNIIN